MTIVEFYSDYVIDNIVSTLANTPDLVIFVGESSKKEKCRQTFQCLREITKSEKTQMEYRSVNIRELSKIINVLDDIVLHHENCQFDLTGGNELCLVAAGILFGRYGTEKLDLHQYNIKTGRVYDCDMDGDVVSSNIPVLTVSETVQLHGGSIVSYISRKNGHYPWNFDEEFCQDIRAMWEINRSDCGQWNWWITLLSDMQEHMISHYGREEDSLTLDFTLDKTFQENYMSSHHGEKFELKVEQRTILRRLNSHGLIHDLRSTKTSLHLTFKNEQVKRCLGKAGTLLELYTCLVAKELTDKEGHPYFNDVMTGVFIDWDGDQHPEDSGFVDTENEIDVVLMRGLIPIFISCKNGVVGDDELYKLDTVTARFGGPYAIRVLAGTTLGDNKHDSKNIGQSNGKNVKSSPEITRRILHLHDRAKMMNTEIIEGIHRMNEQEFGERLKSLA